MAGEADPTKPTSKAEPSEAAPASGVLPTPPVAPKEPAHQGGWLAGLLKVASIFAPLVGKESAEVETTPAELRGRLAAAMGAIGILLASLQLLMGAVDLISRPIAMLGRLLPYLIAALLAGGALLSARIARRSPSLRRRRQAMALLLVIVLVGLGWGSVAAYRAFRPPEGFLVLIADFDGARATRKGDFAQRIGSELIDQLSDVEAGVTIERSLEAYSDASLARAAGRKRQAAMVIWGAYDDFGVTPHVELLREPVAKEAMSIPRLVLNTVRPAGLGAGLGAPPATPSRVSDLSNLTRAPLATTDLELFAAHGAEQITYVVAAILATGLLAEGQYDDALALFDRSLANAPAGDAALDGMERVYFERSVTLHALGRQAEAIADLKKAIEIDPAFMQAHYNLAIAYAGGCAGPDGLAQAVSEAGSAVRLQPDYAVAHRLLGSLYLEAGRAEDALASAQEAVRLDNQDPLALQLLAAAHAALGHEADAAEASRQAVALLQSALAGKTGDEYTLQLTLGDVHVGAGQYAEAMAAYEAAAGLKVDAAAPHRGLGNAYYWQGQADQALAEYRQAAALAPDDPAAPLLIGLILAERGDLQGAIAAQETAAALSACDPAPHLLLGGLYYEQDDLARAAAAYESALALDATNAAAWYVLASLRYQLDDSAAAAEAAQQAVARDPDMVEAQRLLGRVELDLGNPEGALAPAEALVRLAPGDADAQGLLGDVYLGLQRWQEAAEAYEAALTLQDDAGTRIVAGMARTQLGQVDQAIGHYQAAAALDPESRWAWQSLGAAYQQQGQFEAAVDAFEHAVAIEDDALARGQLAAIYQQTGDTAAAITEYERAASLDPGEARYQVRLGGLYAARGEVIRAEAAFRAALAIDAENAEAHAGLADAAYRQCSISSAVQSMATAAALLPAYRSRLAGLYEAQGRDEDAEAIYAELAAAPPEDWLSQLAVADHLFRQNRWDDAQRAYQRLLEVGSAPAGYVTSLIHTALAQIDYAQERLFAAGGEFKQALAAYDANADATAGLGDLALRAGDAAAALEWYGGGLSQVRIYLAGMPAENAASATVLLHVRRSLALARQENPDAAAAALDAALAEAQAAVALTPRSPVAQYALAAAHLARGETVEAEAAFARAGECDRTMLVARTRLEAALARLQPPQ